LIGVDLGTGLTGADFSPERTTIAAIFPRSPSMSGERQDLDPSAQVAASCRAAPGRWRATADRALRPALATYVVEGELPLARAGAKAPSWPRTPPARSRSRSMLKRLKAAKRDPVLERFIIDGENISVHIDGQARVADHRDRRAALGPPAGPGVSVQFCAARACRAPRAASTTIAVPARLARLPEDPGPPPQPQRPSRNGPARAARAAATCARSEEAEEQPRSDRFSLIELE